MFCPECSNETLPGAAFCSACGASLLAVGAGDTVVATVPPLGPLSPAPPPPAFGPPPAPPPLALDANGMPIWVNDSGQGPTALVPQELSGWCWAGFLIPGLWCLVYRKYLLFVVFMVLSLVTGGILGLVASIWCGLEGNRWAWQNRRWESIQQFRATQRVWVIWGIIIWVLMIGIGIASGLSH